MKRCIMTCCSGDWYRCYIPIFVWSILRTWKKVDILIYVRGDLDSITQRVLSLIPKKERVTIIENYKTDYPYLVSTTNSLRFVTGSTLLASYDEVMITDIDFFFSQMPQDLFLWHKMHRDSLMPNDCYSGTHGPLKRPPRPRICPSWTGDFQRIAGGFIVLYPEWWERTECQRKKWDKKLKTGEWGEFREADEVMLYRIIRDSNLPTAPKVPFPRFLRHLHLGDFRPNMKTRYENWQKMRSLLDSRSVKAFLSALEDKSFSKILRITREDPQIDDVLTRTIGYCEKRKRGEV